MSVVEKVKSYIGAYGATDIRSLLHAHHEQISALTEQISSDETKQKRVRAFDRLKPFLTAHARAEEQAVYVPLVKLRGSPDSRADGNEGFVEHSLVDVLMERLSNRAGRHRRVEGACASPARNARPSHQGRRARNLRGIG